MALSTAVGRQVACSLSDTTPPTWTQQHGGYPIPTRSSQPTNWSTSCETAGRFWPKTPGLEASVT